MNPFYQSTTTLRRGISLIEVIACMAIVGIMMVPISSVMRASRQAVIHAESGNVESELRDGSRWLRQQIQDNSLVQVHSNAIELKRTTGEHVKIYVKQTDLVIDNGKEAVVLIPDVLGVDFGEIKQSIAPGDLIGVKFAIYMLDQSTGNKTSLTSVVSLPTQY